MDEHHDQTSENGEPSRAADVSDAVKREKSEPVAGTESDSIWAYIAAAVVLVLGGAYLGEYSGGGLGMKNTYAVAGYGPGEFPTVEGVEVAEESSGRPWWKAEA